MKIKFQDIELAFVYVSSSQPLMNSAYISKTTGQIFYHSEMYDSDELPEDFYEKHDYIEIPHKNDLDLGQRLVWQFVNTEIPGLADKIKGFFSRRGAYSKYKSFLEEIGLLKKWFEFEETSTKETLKEWCNENDIKLDG
jgi:hypothetical protein